MAHQSAQESDIENQGFLSEEPGPSQKHKGEHLNVDDGAEVVVVKWENYKLPIPLDHAVFMRKVFLTLSLQLLVTAGVIACCVFIDPVKDWMVQNFYFGFIGMTCMICLLCALMFNVDKYPLNIVLLAIFTLFMSWMVGGLCAAYATAFNAELVVQAFGIALLVFVSLALFASQTKCNLLPLGLLAFMLMNALFWWGMWAIIFGWYNSSFYSLMFVIIFSMLILFDVWRMCNMPVFDPNAWIPASINLYLDFINLFLWLLRLMARQQ